MKKVVRSEDFVGGGRVPGSKQWCTNFSEVCGPSSIQNGWTKVNCQRNENNRRWRRPYDVCMIRSYWELYFGEQHDNKKGYVFKSECHDTAKIYRSRRKGCRSEATNSSAMGLVALWYRAEEVENAEVNSKYQDKAKGQRLEDFIRSVSTSFSQRYPKVGDFKLMQECSTKDQSMQYVVLYLFDSEE
ncbi:hypothetical protein B296_00002694 [Ensete ventricosum]|uniref:Uncharacterized protein n=1 Tax=Ensete ventricosum TaxID=4639 RepID=A0A426ZS95_ENSVE|nr:hypothetical protein B296_00002694 [Ensete ventricosum]